MTRPTLRLAPTMESLEVRQVLSGMGGPTADQQYLIELINLVRTNPAAAADRITADIQPDVQATLDHYGVTVSGLKSELQSATPMPPLAYSAALTSAAQAQSDYQASVGQQTHDGPGGGTGQRVQAAGFDHAMSWAENTFAYADSTDEAMQSFLFDWGVADHGHYKNLLQPGTAAKDAYQSVGVGMTKTTNNGLGPLVVTQDFGSQSNAKPQILGVVYDDPNRSGYYNIGEGQGGVTVEAVNVASGQRVSTTTWGSGGYQMAVDGNGTYRVTATENGQVIASKQVSIGDVNTKVDFVHDPSAPAAPAPVPAPSPAPAPMPAPAPTPVVTATPVAPPEVTVAVADDQATRVTTTTRSDWSHVDDNDDVVVPLVARDAGMPTASMTPSDSTTQPSWLSRWSRWRALSSAAN